MRKLLNPALAALAAVLLAATAAGAATVKAGANANARVGGSRISAQEHAAVTTRTAFVPRGFHEGRKTGWHGRHMPPGWSEGRKTGWHHAGRPPGLSRH
jgi:hypothetical protein